jgi:hypothetical protein
MRRSGDESQPLLLRIDRARDAACLFDVEPLLAARLARAQHVEAHVRDDGRQPRADVVHAAAGGPVEPQPRFLHRDIGRGIPYFTGAERAALTVKAAAVCPSADGRMRGSVS